MDYRDNPRNIMCHHSKWSSFTPPWWSGFTLPLTAEFIDLLEVGKAIVTLKGRVTVLLLIGFPRIGLTKGYIKIRI